MYKHKNTVKRKRDYSKNLKRSTEMEIIFSARKSFYNILTVDVDKNKASIEKLQIRYSIMLILMLMAIYLCK